MHMHNNTMNNWVIPRMTSQDDPIAHVYDRKGYKDSKIRNSIFHNRQNRKRVRSGTSLYGVVEVRGVFLCLDQTSYRLEAGTDRFRQAFLLDWQPV
jgi:hypothetical protein